LDDTKTLKEAFFNISDSSISVTKFGLISNADEREGKCIYRVVSIAK
jgi:hypothetical protein